MKTPREWQRLWLQMGFDDLLFIDLLAQVQREAFDAGARAMFARCEGDCVKMGDDWLDGLDGRPEPASAPNSTAP